MVLSDQRRAYLEGLCRTFRREVVELLYQKQTGHPGGSLSVCEILTTLYFEGANVGPALMDDPARDRIILSKGHAAPMLYRVLAEKAYFPVEEMRTLRDFASRLQGHPSSRETPGVDLSSGPLGLGLSAGLGMALAARMEGLPSRIFVVLGDGELDEGTVWEACMCAAKYKVERLTAIVDWNGVQLDGCNDAIMPLLDLRRKFEAFGWNCIECDGHDVEAIWDAVERAKACSGKPSVIVLDTIKGHGIQLTEGKVFLVSVTAPESYMTFCI